MICAAAHKGEWAGKYNGLGGHVERGEDVLSSARRELQEESGLSAELWLCGILITDTDPGICVFVFCGENAQGQIKAGREGEVQWVSRAMLPRLPIVDDLRVLIDHIHPMKRGDAPFSARSFRQGDSLVVKFAE